MARSIDLRIPPIFARPLRLLEEFSEDQFEAFLVGLSALAPNASREAVENGLAAEVEGFEADDATTLVDFLMQTRALVSRIGIEVEPLSVAVVKSYAEDRDTGTLTERLEAVLDSRFLAVREKISGLSREPEPRFESARCLVDLRPIFDTDGSTDSVLGFVVINTLLLELDGDQKDRALAVRMDSDGLERLKKVIDRALEKGESLSATLAASGLRDLTSEKSDE